MDRPYKQEDIELMTEVDLRKLLLEIKESVRWSSLEDSRSCKEFVEWIKPIFVEEWTEEEQKEFK